MKQSREEFHATKQKESFTQRAQRRVSRNDRQVNKSPRNLRILSRRDRRVNPIFKQIYNTPNENHIRSRRTPQLYENSTIYKIHSRSEYRFSFPHGGKCQPCKDSAAGDDKGGQPNNETFKQSNTQTIEHILVHTGQHYDDRMSKAFFESLGIPEADINLGIGSGTHAEQVGHTMIAFEKVCMEEQPDWVVVVGDVNATLACSVTAKKLGIKVCHIEAGLRSGDMTMPEEINRLVTDRLSDLLLIPDKLSGQNLRNEGVEEHKISFVGNIMIDTLEANREKAAQ